MKINPTKLYLIERLLNVSKATVAPDQSQKTGDIRRALFNQCSGAIVELINYVSPENGRSTYYEPLTDGIADPKELLNAVVENPDLVRVAIARYTVVADEEVYATLFDKPIIEMTGYEFTLLYARSEEKAYNAKWIDTVPK